MQFFVDWWRIIGLTGQIMACAAIPSSLILILQAILMLVGGGLGHDSDSFDSDGADVDAGDFDADGSGFDVHGIDGGGAHGFDAHGFDAHGIDVHGFDAHGFDGGGDYDAGGIDVHGLDVHGIDVHGLDVHDLDGSGDGTDAALGSGSLAHHFVSGAHHGYGDADHSDADHPDGGKSGGPKMLTVRGIIAFFAIGGWAGLAALSAGIRPIWSVQISLLAGVAAMIMSYLVIRFAMRMQSSGNINLRNALSQTAEVYIKIPPMRENTGKVMMLLQERLVEVDAVTDEADAIKPNTIVEVIGTVGSDCLVVRTATAETE